MCSNQLLIHLFLSFPESLQALRRLLADTLLRCPSGLEDRVKEFDFIGFECSKLVLEPDRLLEGFLLGR